MRHAVRWLPALALLGLSVLPAQGQQMVYQPRNPAFGGNYLNYSWMLSSAQAQNSYQDEQATFGRDPLQDFEDSLQRQILSQLSRELIGNRFGELDLSQPGEYNFGDFLVTITPGLGEISIRIFNVLTGDESIIAIPAFP